MIRRVLLGATLGLILAAGASASTQLPSVYSCPEAGAAVRPKTILLTCDGNYSLVNVIWSRWTPTSAAGTGAAHKNNCTPNCAAGTFHIYRGVHIRLTRPKSCSDGKRLFTRIAWTFTKHRPPGAKRRTLANVPLLKAPRCP